MKTTHTPEPWEVYKADGEWPLIMAGGTMGKIVANINTESCPDLSSIPAFVTMPSKANAARIVACVNACAGLADPAADIAALREALLGCIDALTESAKQHRSRQDSGHGGACETFAAKARAALARTERGDK